MRISDKLLFLRGQKDLQASKTRYAKAQAALTTGLQVRRAADDPGAAALAVRHAAARRRHEDIERNAGRAADTVTAMDAALGDVNDALVRAKQLAVQLSNDTYDAAQRAEAATEVQALFDTVLGRLNMRHGGRYVFGGAKDDVPPFDASGAYQGDQSVLQVEVAPGLYQDAQIRTDVVIEGGSGGVNVLTVLKDLASALAIDDTTGIQQAVGDLDTAIEQVSAGRARLGTAMNAFDEAVRISRTAADRARLAESHLTESDLVEAASTLAYAQQGLEAAIAATSKSFESSLLDRM
ncbi:MAG: flagellar biosynthesis protein FlgL [Deltaproteobacteria bacterium]|nr:MAG: flagellar biosynthesis protein FlgL [Deltaproteobacteria bacterium]